MNNPAKVSGLNRFYGQVYGFLGLGIGLSALVSYLVLGPLRMQASAFINGFPLGFMGLWILELILVMVLSAKAQKNPSMALGGFIAYAILNGITLAVTLSFYSIGTITSAFATTALTFMGMSLFGAFTKRDLSGIGRAAFGLIFGIIIAMLLNVFLLHSSPVELFLSFAMVAVFSGITAYDNQMIRSIYYNSNGEAHSGVAIFMALSLYLNFINLLLAFLRIFGIFGSND